MLDNIEVTADGDLDQLVGWRGARVHLHLLSNHGGSINALAGTLQGVDNIEVPEGRIKLYDAWIEQDIAGGRAALLVGLSDLNVDFYQNDAAGILVAPAFGIGSELSATGPNGPSIFPSTALTARLNVAIAKSGYVRAAVVNARAGVLGDRPGIDFKMRDGALLIAEAGVRTNGKLAVGAWRYTRQQDDLRACDANGDPIKRTAIGAYVLVDQRVWGDDSRGIDLFFRAGVSDGKTTPFRGGFQAGLLANGLIPGRPDGQFSFGVAQGLLSRAMRRTVRDSGNSADAAETGVEITYLDRIGPVLSVQPDFQYVRRAFAGGGRRSTVVLGLRLIAEFGAP
ncbi:carbohydrate-selective porin OprB [Novosphingobium sp. Rr 2-17]|nr:carbohydrate-selective porin OprB [Novosphingobium sp. Rr 2-17]